MTITLTGASFQGWLKDRLAEIDLAQVMPPGQDLEEGDARIGRIESEYVKRLHGLKLALYDEARTVARNFLLDSIDKKNLSADKKAEINALLVKVVTTVRDLDDLMKTVEAIFWAEVRFTLDEAARTKVTSMCGDMIISRAWEVGCRPNPRPDSMSRSLVLDLMKFGVSPGTAEYLRQEGF